MVAYSPLVKYVAGRTAAGLPPHVEEADLISYGLVGLISAIERFDLGREIKFETYAITRIKGAIIDELRSMDWVPRSVRARAREIERANSKLEHALQRAPTDAELAAELGLTDQELQDSLLAISHSSIAALDELWSVSDASGDQVSLMDTIEDPGAPDPARALDIGDMKDRIADADRATARAREARDRALLLREPDPAGDRRGARGHRVAHLPAAHQGRPATALAHAGRHLRLSRACSTAGRLAHDWAPRCMVVASHIHRGQERSFPPCTSCGSDSQRRPRRSSRGREDLAV